MGTPVPETAMKFVHRVGVVGVPIHEEAYARDTHLAGIACVLNVMALLGLWTVSHQLVMRFQTLRAESVQDGLDPLTP